MTNKARRGEYNKKKFFFNKHLLSSVRAWWNQYINLRGNKSRKQHQINEPCFLSSSIHELLCFIWCWFTLIPITHRFSCYLCFRYFEVALAFFFELAFLWMRALKSKWYFKKSKEIISLKSEIVLCRIKLCILIHTSW